MLEACERGGERVNVSHMHNELVDLTPAIQKRVEDTIRHGLRFVEDKVDIIYHSSNVCITQSGFANNVPFYPLDKDLSKQEIEDINLHFLGYVPFENTAIQTYVTIMVNEILRAVIHELDRGADRVVLHFAPADTIEYAGTVATTLYGCSSKDTLQMETSFLVEAIKND